MARRSRAARYDWLVRPAGRCAAAAARAGRCGARRPSFRGGGLTARVSQGAPAAKADGDGAANDGGDAGEADGGAAKAADGGAAGDGDAAAAGDAATGGDGGAGKEGKEKAGGEAGDEAAAAAAAKAKEEEEEEDLLADVPLTEEQQTMLEEMDKIEDEYKDLKEKLYEDKVTALRREMLALKYGQLREFKAQLRELEKMKQEKMAAADQWRQYQLSNINAAFDAERKSADDEYRTEKENIREKMLNLLLERQRKLEEEMNQFSLKELEYADARAVTRKLRRRAADGTTVGPAGPSVRRRLNIPTVVYQLKEAEATDDIETLIQRCSDQGGKRRGKRD